MLEVQVPETSAAAALELVNDISNKAFADFDSGTIIIRK
jgi:hypothetical protein